MLFVGSKKGKNITMIIFNLLWNTLVDLNTNFLLKEHFGNKIILRFQYNPKINFGIVTMDKANNLISFLEKPNLNHWINIGFIIISKKIFSNF